MNNRMPIPIIRKEHYDAILAIPTENIPKTFDVWQRWMAEERAQFIRTGATIVPIEIVPEEFSRFCKQAGISANFDAIKTFILKKFAP